jgi:actin-like ATPase involved in cell morphogenesis
VKAIAAPLRDMIKAIKDVLQETPPELAADIIDQGITMTGGSSLAPQFSRTRLPPHRRESPARRRAACSAS